MRDEGNDRQDSSERTRMRNKGRRKEEGREREGNDTICYTGKTRKRRKEKETEGRRLKVVQNGCPRPTFAAGIHNYYNRIM
jgi:hypothetical protein